MGVLSDGTAFLTGRGLARLCGVDSSRISTDELRSYNALNDSGYDHACVRHAAKEFAKGDTHVNSVEGFWSRLKVSISGTHVWVSRKHLNKYVDEFAFRYNNRITPDAMFDVALAGLKRPA